MLLNKRDSVWPRFYFILVALIPGHLFDWGVEWGFAMVTTIGGLLFYPRFHRVYPRMSTPGLCVISIITLISVFSYIFTLIGGRFETGPRDLVEVSKPLMIYLSCTLGFCFGTFTLQQARKSCAYVLFFTIISAGVLVVQPPILVDITQYLYESTKTYVTEFNVRVSIPFENPNFLGLFAVLSLCVAIFFGDKPDLRLAILAVIVIALTGSRTAWITTLGVIFIFLTIKSAALFSRRQLPSRSALITLGAIVLGGAYVAPGLLEENQRLIDFIEVLTNLDFSQDESYAERIEMRSNASSLIAERLFFGWGAIKYSNLSVVDNQYVSLLLRFGIVGCLIATAALGFLFLIHYSRLAGVRKGYHAVMLWIVVLAWMWVGSFVENIRLTILLTMLFASSITNHEKIQS